MGFRQFESKADGEKDNAVETKDNDGEKNVAVRAQSIKKTTSRSRSEKRSNPNLNQKGKREADVPGASAKGALEEREFSPGSDACGDGEPGNAPTRFDAEHPREWECGEIAKSGGEDNAYDGKAKRSAGVAQSVKARGVETAEGGSEEAHGGTGKNSPDVDNVGVLELARLINAGNDDIAEREKADDRGNDEERDLAQAAIQAHAEQGSDFVGGPDGTAHYRKLRGGNGHTEEADRESVKRLRISERSHGTGGKPPGEKRVDVGTDLNNATAHEDGEEIADDGANIFGLMKEGKL